MGLCIILCTTPYNTQQLITTCSVALDWLLVTFHLVILCGAGCVACLHGAGCVVCSLVLSWSLVDFRFVPQLLSCSSDKAILCFPTDD